MEKLFYLFGVEIQELCECNARCWRLFDDEWDSMKRMHNTYAFCPLCDARRHELYLVPVTRYYRP